MPEHPEVSSNEGINPTVRRLLLNGERLSEQRGLRAGEYSPEGIALRNGVVAVIVTYFPDHARLERLLSALLNDVDAAVLVDNGSPYIDEQRLAHAFPSLLVRRLQTNKGLAAAQNAGIELAALVGASYVLFLDQDSIPEQGMAARLCIVLRRLAAEGRKVACIGPQFRAVAGRDPSGFARLGWFGLRRNHSVDRDLAIECDFLISSGSLIPMDVIREVGGMEEGLFIDQVDTEWCLRARAKGYQVFGAYGAILEHRLGEDVHRIWIGRWRNLFRHKPYRYYYIFRNSLLLFRRDYVSVKWMWFQLSWLLALFIKFGIFRSGQGSELRMMLKGIAHGIRGVTGKLEAG